MGGQISTLLLFPAPSSSYDNSLSNLIWIDEGYADMKAPFGDTVAAATEQEALGLSTEIYVPCLLLRAEQSQHTLLYFHGNSCDIGEMYSELDLLQSHLHCHIMAIEFPGYGICTGNTTTLPETINRWGRAAFNWLVYKANINPLSIILFGRSIGTGPATRLAAQLKIEGINIAALVLHSPYISIHKVVSDYNFLGTWLIENYWDLKNDLDILSPDTPLLIVHGKKDDIIKTYHGEYLYDTYGGHSSVKTGYFPQHSNHNTYFVIDDLAVPLESFLANKSRSRECTRTPIVCPDRYKVCPQMFEQSSSQSYETE